MKRCCCWGRDGGLGPLLLLLLLGVAAMLPTGDAHSAMTIPQPRNAVDSDEQPWGGKVPHPLPFEPWCPIPSKAAAGKDDRNISGSNGQACFCTSSATPMPIISAGHA